MCGQTCSKTDAEGVYFQSVPRDHVNNKLFFQLHINVGVLYLVRLELDTHISSDKQIHLKLSFQSWTKDLKMAVECVIKNAAKSVGEGPHWDDVTNTLLYVDIQENAIRKYCPESKEHSTIQLGMQFYCFIII